MNAGNDFSVEADVNEVNVKGHKPGRNDKMIDRV
jgi:hypothetical protein